jgi:hypothetical protein
MTSPHLRRRPPTLAGLTLLVLAACGSRPATRSATPEEAARLYPELSVTISKAEPPPGCAPLGTVQGGGWSAEAAYDSIRTKAAKRHANYVVLDGVAGAIFGRAFACPVPSPDASSTPEAGQAGAPACVPDCSPGYVCVVGKCVSACNPLCAAGQLCGADRTCHLVR